MATIPAIKLNDGNQIPAIGFGTWRISEDEAEVAVTNAINTGYRLIDTAKMYANEAGVGRGIAKGGIPREELFITTKLITADQGYDSTLKAFGESLSNLKLDYLDLYLIHWPGAGPQARFDSWRAMTELKEQGKVESIGVSNFSIRHLQEFLERFDVVPAVNQVEFHPFIYADQKELLEFCHQHKILLEAYSPLARTQGFNNPKLTKIAQSHSKTPAQVMLRWEIQQGIVPIPKSLHVERMRENMDVFDFELSKEELSTIDSLSDGSRLVDDPTDLP